MQLEPTCINGTSVGCVGTCQVDTCICPEGFVHDSYFLHLESCSVPDWIIPVLGIVCLLSTMFIIAFIAGHYQGLKNNVKTIVMGTGVCTLAFDLAFGTLYASGYSSPGFWGFFTLAVSCNVAVNAKYMKTILVMHIRNGFKTPNHTQLNVLCGLLVFQIALPIFVVFAGSFVWTPTEYNWFVTLGFASIPGYAVVQTPLMTWTLTKIINTMTASIDTVVGASSNIQMMEKMVDARGRLRTFRNVVCVGMGLGGIPITPLSLWAYHNHRNYMWILLIPMVVFYKLGLLTMILTSTKRRRMFGSGSSKTSSSTLTSKLSTTNGRIVETPRIESSRKSPPAV
ncbi:MAG: hypothetical protein ACTSUE_05990 [Promethearchaeota archaeon]